MLQNRCADKEHYGPNSSSGRVSASEAGGHRFYTQLCYTKGVTNGTSGYLTLRPALKGKHWLLFFHYYRTANIIQTSSPKGNDAHLRATIQSKKKWKHQFFRRLRAANSLVHGRIWPTFKLIQALMYVIIRPEFFIFWFSGHLESNIG